jgi:hypothetical protein
MLPLRIPNATRVLAENQDEYHALAIVDEVIEGVQYMHSLWELTPKEQKQIEEGGRIILTIIGTAHPPVNLRVQPLEQKDQAN